MRTVLISGASIAGPALAHWLARYGFAVTVVERAPELRGGGQAVDVKGETHLAVLDRMGVLEEVRSRRTGGTDLAIVDAGGRKLATLPAEFTGGDLEILRGDLATVLHAAGAAGCEYVFGDEITSLTERPDGVDVTFATGAPRSFDLVIGADGIHSAVRRLAFGPESRFVTHLGYHYAIAEPPGGQVTSPERATGLMYNEPGLMASIDHPKAPAFFVFASAPLGRDAGWSELAAAYATAGWDLPRRIGELRETHELYLDSISRAVLPEYATGRVALLGDSAWGNTLGGFGTGLALVGAYVLAGELATRTDHATAFASYTAAMRPYAAVARKGNAGPYLAPRRRSAIALRNAVLRSPFLMRQVLKLTDDHATRIELPDYRRTAERR